MTRWLTLTILLVAIPTASCAKYWTRDQATYEDFLKDHRECIVTTGTPVVKDPNLVIPNEQDYRRCLMARGWQRIDKFRPSGPYYRGYEEREIGTIKINPML